MFYSSPFRNLKMYLPPLESFGLDVFTTPSLDHLLNVYLCTRVSFDEGGEEHDRTPPPLRSLIKMSTGILKFLTKTYFMGITECLKFNMTCSKVSIESRRCFLKKYYKSLTNCVLY